MKRVLTQKEQVKRGCRYCTDCTTTVSNSLNRNACKHSKCPYTELDKYPKYSDYIKSCDSIDLNELLKSIKKQ
jgi:hypothetical protein